MPNLNAVPRCRRCSSTAHVTDMCPRVAHFARTATTEGNVPAYRYPVKNLASFTHSNWTWAAPGTKGNVCDCCGTLCFCIATAGLLSRTRSQTKKITALVDVVAPQDAYPQDAALQVATPQVTMQDGIAAFLQYDSE
jgi:hypothetical protein